MDLQQPSMASKRRKFDPNDLPYKDSGLAYKGSGRAFQSVDLVISPEILERYNYMLLRGDSSFVSSPSKDNILIERHLTVLFGVVQAFKSQCHFAWFWSIVNRYWLEMEVSDKDLNRDTKDLVQAVVLARGHNSLYTTCVDPAKTPLGSLIDDWAQNCRDHRHIRLFNNPTPTPEEHDESKRLQRTVGARIERDPLRVFSHEDMFTGKQLVT